MEDPPTQKIKVFNEDCFTNAISIEIIPKEVLCIIFSHLDRQSVKNVTAGVLIQVCSVISCQSESDQSTFVNIEYIIKTAQNVKFRIFRG